jgi:hypothetical protein
VFIAILAVDLENASYEDGIDAAKLPWLPDPGQEEILFKINGEAFICSQEPHLRIGGRHGQRNGFERPA